MVIIITGTPGTGKSTLAKQIAQDEDRRLVNITELCKQRGLDTEWDENRNCFVIDVVDLTKILSALAEADPNSVIEGHMAHYLSPHLVTRCIVTKCDLPELKKRLEKREYEESKVRENLDCEIFDVCFVEAQEHGHAPEVVDTTP